MPRKRRTIVSEEITFKHNGYDWVWIEIEPGSNPPGYTEPTQGSLVCLNPALDEHDVDQTDWPTDAELSAIVKRPVKFFDAGDADNGVEGIYNLVKS
jgi:hypothetical protein